MSAANGLDLSGTGAAYVRVSDDIQDTQRQYAALHAFAKRHGVTIPKPFWFEDEGWARDTAERRPEFQRMLKLAEAGQVQWIVVAELDRFGTKNAKQFMRYLCDLDDWKCRLYDAAGKDWTSEDIGTVITAVVQGEKSKEEQHGISKRTLGSKIQYAREGEWQGGPVRLGLEIVCYSRSTGKELWRVVYEGLDDKAADDYRRRKGEQRREGRKKVPVPVPLKRRKIYPDGRTERFDGVLNFPKCQPATEVLRVAPSNDPAKVAAAVEVFKRFATESISYTALAHHLNEQGFHTSYGGMFQAHHVESMLADPIYMGFYTWNRSHAGKFHRWAGGQTVLEINYEEKGSKNDKGDWIQSHRLFEPLIDATTWAAVQHKLEQQSKRSRAPRSAALYLSGLAYCGNCGAAMVAGPVRKTTRNPRKDGYTGDRYEYFCGSYFKAVPEKRRHECSCLRNGVFQDTLEVYVTRYLEETGTRIQILTSKILNPATRLEEQQEGAWQKYIEGFQRLTSYLAEHHPDDYHRILQADKELVEAVERASREAQSDPGEKEGVLAELQALDESVRRHADDPAVYGPQPDAREQQFLTGALDAYYRKFDPARLQEEVKRLEAEHTTLYRRYADLPTPRAKAKAKAELEAIETRIAEMEKQQEDLGDIVANALREVQELGIAIGLAEQAMTAAESDRALRQRAQALQAVIQRIECSFTATGLSGGGWGKKNSRLVKVTVYPVVGESVEFAVPSKGTLLYSSAHSRI
jgi:DNA invertase Pin-like site-specific DNA recombinase